MRRTYRGIPRNDALGGRHHSATERDVSHAAVSRVAKAAERRIEMVFDASARKSPSGLQDDSAEVKQ